MVAVAAALWTTAGPVDRAPVASPTASALPSVAVSGAASAPASRRTAEVVTPSPAAPLEPLPEPTSAPGAPASVPAPPAGGRSLAGRVIVIDPGHQLGNSRFPAQVNASVDAGGFTKACNTTGTATDGGYPEATFAWEVAVLMREELEAAGATVVLTRSSNSASAWGPCIDERGRIGNPGWSGPTADLEISLHGDGNLSAGARGFHVIAPESRAGWTDDIAAPSLVLARAVRDGLLGVGVPVSTYLGVDGLDVRGDLGTLNWSDKPTVMVELGNMRDPGDAALMTSAAGRRTYAVGVVAGVTRFLG
ncbi:N-acetylmuramoyl-L-alanine amidase [Nocardioides sp. GY 10113]|nr:N-acetylmuramoyl-L-alanine amidase [Nocardioides sp. GY 10113]